MPALALALVSALSWIASCATVDPSVFDERLRTATFRAYVGAIETQFGGLEAAGVSADDLRERYGSRAASAESPAEFYRVLSEMLADLDDPHAVLRVSPRFWQAPVAEPEWTQFVLSRGSVWVGLPALSIRSREELALAVADWTRSFGPRALGDLEPDEVALFLRRSAAFGGPGGIAAAREPLEWLRLRRIDGFPVETPHDAELVVRGALGSTVEFEVDLEGTPVTIALLRNAGVFESEVGEGSVRRRLSPIELAELLESRNGRARFGSGTLVSGRAPLSANRARRLALLQSAFRRGRRFPLIESEAEAFGIEAWRLRTPEGRRVAYLRIERFEPRTSGSDDSDGEDVVTRPIETDEGVKPRLDATLRSAFRALDVTGWSQGPGEPIDAMIVDVTGNAGGSWVETGLLLSYFLDPGVEVVPHAVESVSQRGNWFFRTRTRARQFLARANVPWLRPKQLFVLVDQNTASAGEITAATLRGVAGAKLIGERTAGAEYSTAEFLAPDGSVLRIGLSGGMQPPLGSFQGRGLTPDISIEPLAQIDERIDLEAWRATFRFVALSKALEKIDRDAADVELE
ncbi:Peptidase family S41 [Planctomycetes bacterium Poly30]|uniref:Peptidase family S41 n=1 Tax=Saltatorellus ferox TaxID=2528018 RepID=A0A518ETI2_9BACT|nr:Peptidase family S41 [Planctomycetes bacterium Poly30]